MPISAKCLSPATILFLVAACSAPKEYVPIVDTTKIENPAKFDLDVAECQQVVEAVDYSDQEAVAAMKGAGAGAAVVGTGAAVVAGAGGIVLAPVAIPIGIVAAATGAGISSNNVEKQEQKMRATVLNNCLKERGYTVLSAE